MYVLLYKYHCIAVTRLSSGPKEKRWITVPKTLKCGQHVNERSDGKMMQIEVCRVLDEMSCYQINSSRWVRGREAKKKFWPEWMPGEGTLVMIQGNY